MLRLLFTFLLVFPLLICGCASKQTDLIKKGKADARDLIQKGNESLSEGRYKEAARFYDRARFIAISIDDLVARADADNNLGHLYLLAGDPVNADRKFKEAYDWSRALNYQPGLAAAENGLGMVALRNSDYAEAERRLTAALDLAKKTSLRIAIKSNLGNLKRLTGDTADARPYLSEAISESLKIKHHRLTAVAAYRMALLEKAENNIGAATEWAITALEEDKKVEFAPGIVMDLELLSELSAVGGDNIAAGLYSRRAQDARIVLADRIDEPEPR